MIILGVEIGRSLGGVGKSQFTSFAFMTCIIYVPAIDVWAELEKRSRYPYDTYMVKGNNPPLTWGFKLR